MLKIVGLCVGGAILLTACAPQPGLPPKIVGLPIAENWVQQDQATNVQDWDRAAGKIADAMQNKGLLATAPSPHGIHGISPATTGPIYVDSRQRSTFIREFTDALKSEILRRNGVVSTSPLGSQVIELDVDIVPWGSRLIRDPDRVRTEAVWKASLVSQGRVLMNIREPFYILASDVPLYTDFSQDFGPLARAARPLRYAQ